MYEQKDHKKISESVKMLYNLHYNAWLHWTIDLLQWFAPMYCKMPSSSQLFILQLCYVVIGSCLRTIVVAYHEFHTHSKTLYQQVKLTKAHND